MSRARALSALTTLGLLACSAAGPADTEVVDTEPPWTPPDAGVVQLTTRDAIVLEADYLPAEVEGAPAVVLVHMIPPFNSRADWPGAFRRRLADQGWSVLVVDRRGAGTSEGNPEDAYLGEKGAFDVEACVERLTADGYGPVALVGASNGTTSIVDYTALAGAEDLPAPVALVHMSPGEYTEAQTSLATVADLPMLFQYPPDESAWPESKRDLDPGSWTFQAYEGGAHGTRMFGTDAATAVQDDLVTFLQGALAE